MIPLIILFGLGFAALAAYELVPKAREWTDEHVAAIRATLGAHSETEAHIADAHDALAEHQDLVRQVPSSTPSVPPVDPAVAQRAAAAQALLQDNMIKAGLARAAVQPPDPWAQPAPSAPADPTSIAVRGATLLKSAWESLLAAGAANAKAAAATTAMAATAKTPQEKERVAQSANLVETRGKTIKDAQATLGGTGHCGLRTYGVSAAQKDALLAKLRASGMVVTGSNPWDIDTKTVVHVRLRALWEPAAQVLHLIVVAPTDPSLYPALCGLIWGQIEPALTALGVSRAVA